MIAASRLGEWLGHELRQPIHFLVTYAAAVEATATAFIGLAIRRLRKMLRAAEPASTTAMS